MYSCRKYVVTVKRREIGFRVETTLILELELHVLMMDGHLLRSIHTAQERTGYCFEREGVATAPKFLFFVFKLSHSCDSFLFYVQKR